MPPSPSRPASSPRLRAERGGRRAERIAALLLMAKGYSILERRYRTPVGELDLVARRGAITVFIEVKARAASAGMAEALAAVDRRRIARAAQYYIARHPQVAATPMRFDVIFLAPWTWPRHLKNAFLAE